MEEAIVLYPSPAIGHLISMVELGKLILTRNPSLSVHILVAPPPYQPESVLPYISSVSSVTFHRLPTVTLSSTTTTTRHPHESVVLETLCFSNPNVHRTLFSISHRFNIRALIIDFFCTAVIDILYDFDFPFYYFFTSGAACLSSFLYLPTIHETTNKNLKDIDMFLDIPGVSGVKGSDMAKPLQERDDEVYECFLTFAKQLPKSAGIIVNTFEALEHRAIKAITEELCLHQIFPIGPIIVEKKQADGDQDSCLRWLDLQIQKSVVFLCFGSLGLFSEEQLKEIAVGLERSGQKFLWVVRDPSGLVEPTKPDLESLLPEGFLDRTGDRGLVVKSWAPQVAVLNHKSVGGFVTHCGWNSILEAVCAGIPMVAWPLYAEQHFNRVILVEEIKIAMPMNSSEMGFVRSTEVEKRVRELMEDGPIRDRTNAMMAAAEAALTETGSSHAALTKLLESWKLK